MRIKFQHSVIFITLLILLSDELFSQYNLDNRPDPNRPKGTIINNGIIKLKNGQVRALNDTMGGRFEFLQKSDLPGIEQAVPTIVFNQLVLRYLSKKYVTNDTTFGGLPKPLETMDSLIVADSVPFEVDIEEVNAKASVFNDSKISGKKDVRLNGNLSQQDIFGNGQYSNLNIDNPLGADVINGGGFRINSKLELTNGEFRNQNSNNFDMVDSTWIVRHVNGSVRNEPNFLGHVSVKYTGTGSISSTTGEIPTDSTKLLNLRNETTQGITITRNVVVNDTLYLKSPIRTEPDSNNKFVLTLTTLRDPIFDGADA